MTKLIYFILVVVLILISLTIYNKPAEAFDSGKCDKNYGNCEYEPPKELEED